MEQRFLGPEEPTADVTVADESLYHHHDSPPRIPSSGDAPVLARDGTDSDSDGEFEFPFVTREYSPAGAAAADDIFSDRTIRPCYPVFGRAIFAPPAPALRARRRPLARLFLEESRNSSVGSTSSSSSASLGLNGVSPESYCLWAPGVTPLASSSTSQPPRKIASTGAIGRWRRISELVIGRTHSDGKEKLFAFLPANKDEKDKTKSRISNKAATEVDTATAGHRIAYDAKAGGGGAGGTRRTFLPYRPELVGFLGNVNGLSRRHHHPFRES